MHFTGAIALAASVAVATAQNYKGFNYGSVNTDNSPITEAQYERLFNKAKGLPGASGFTSARLFTSVQAGTPNTPSEAFQAASKTKTSLLLGVWGSGGQAAVDNELAAIRSALSAYPDLADLVVAVSVGSEDLYRVSDIGIQNNAGVGAGPATIADYIGQVRSALSSTALRSKPIGHVDTYTAWINGSNSAVVDAVDVVLTDAYPYFEYQKTNPIDAGFSLFTSAYDQTVGIAKGKPVWVTETGWPVSGPVSGNAIASIPNAKTYWDEVGCGYLFGKINTWWYTLQDASPSTPNPSFGIIGSNLDSDPLYDLSCSGVKSSAKPSSEAPSTSAAAEPVAGGPGASAEQSAKSSPTPGAGGEPAQPEKPAVTPASPVAAPPSTLITKTTTLPSASSGACPASLSGPYEYPHLIVPIDKEQPDKASGTSYNGTISSTVSSIFNFDLPASYAGKTCSLVFLFPTQDKLETSAYSLSGSGGFDVAKLKSPATEQTTYNSCPSVDYPIDAPSSVTPGNAYVIGSGLCRSGERVGYKVGGTGSLSLNYFQDYNPSPIGFYVTVC